jgi:hypothetical protein
MGKVFAVVVTRSVAAPAFAPVKSAEQRQDFQRTSAVCQASVNVQRGRRAVGDRGLRHPRTDRATAATNPQRTTGAARASHVMGGPRGRRVGVARPPGGPSSRDRSGDIGKETT